MNFWQHGRTFMIRPEAFENYCKGCQFLKSNEKKKKLMVVTCARKKCMYDIYEEIWEKKEDYVSIYE